MSEDEDPLSMLRDLINRMGDEEQRIYEERLASAIARRDQAQAQQADAMRQQNRQMIWAAAASAAITSLGMDQGGSSTLHAGQAGAVADAMLAEFDKRWPA